MPLSISRRRVPSLRANNLRIVATLMESFPQFIANRKAAADPWKRAKMERIVLLLKAALEARGKVGLKMNVPEKQLQSVLDTLPSLRLPTRSSPEPRRLARYRDRLGRESGSRDYP